MWWLRFRVVLAVAALVVVGWVLVTAWPAVLHGHPAYGVVTAVTAVAATLVLAHSRPRPGAVGADRPSAPDDGVRPRLSAWRVVGRVAGTVGAVLVIGVVAWARPFPAHDDAVAAMRSDDRVAVEDTATRIVLTPLGEARTTAILFQPGARVDARAYVPTLRPLAEAGWTVVVVKQPLGIAFLSTGALDPARDALPEATAWVVGGHSLGGTVASLIADGHDDDAGAPVTGLVLWASYPASDVSGSLVAEVLSVWATEDGLATPADIEASQQDLPPGAQLVRVDGAAHASFGAYGPQPGDGTPTLAPAEARARIAEASIDFLDGLG